MSKCTHKGNCHQDRKWRAGEDIERHNGEDIVASRLPDSSGVVTVLCAKLEVANSSNALVTSLHTVLVLRSALGDM